MLAHRADALGYFTDAVGLPSLPLTSPASTTGGRGEDLSPNGSGARSIHGSCYRSRSPIGTVQSSPVAKAVSRGGHLIQSCGHRRKQLLDVVPGRGGGPDQISAKVASQLYQYGEVIRVSNDDPVAFNAPAPDSPEATAIAFAKMWDPARMFGWKITGPGHGFTLVNINDWQGAITLAPLSHLGFHAPLLLTSDATSLPDDLDSYFTMVSPSQAGTARR